MIGHFPVGSRPVGATPTAAAAPGGTTNVAANFVQSFAVDGRVAAAFTQSFAIDGRVSADFTQTFAIGLSVQADFVQSFAVDGRVAKDFVQSFAVNGRISADFVQTFTVAANAGMPMSFTPSAARTIKVSADSRTFTGGAFWNLSNPARPVGSKDPDSVIDITFDWSPVLADIQDTIAFVDFELTGVQDAGSFAVGALATVFVSAGTASEVAITCRITSSSTPARIEDRTVFLKIGDL